MLASGTSWAMLFTSTRMRTSTHLPGSGTSGTRATREGERRSVFRGCGARKRPIEIAKTHRFGLAVQLIPTVTCCKSSRGTLSMVVLPKRRFEFRREWYWMPAARITHSSTRTTLPSDGSRTHKTRYRMMTHDHQERLVSREVFSSAPKLCTLTWTRDG
jgi:hypothetical protein